MAKDIGGRQEPQTIGSASFDVGIVDKEVSDGIMLSMKKKIFGRSILIQDEELLNDDLDLSILIDKHLIDLSARGNESPLVYVADNTFSEAFSIRGRYEVKDEMISAKISLVKGYRERVHQFDITGTVSKKEELVSKVVNEVREFMVKMN